MMEGACFTCGFWKQKGAPICDATDYAAGVEDECACCARDSGDEIRVCMVLYGPIDIEDGLFDLVDAPPWSDLGWSRQCRYSIEDVFMG